MTDEGVLAAALLGTRIPTGADIQPAGAWADQASDATANQGASLKLSCNAVA